MPTTQTAFGVFFGDNTFPSATFPDYPSAEAYLVEMGAVARIMAKTDVLTQGTVLPTRVTHGTWEPVPALD